jgi:hypothetical protein
MSVSYLFLSFLLRGKMAVILIPTGSVLYLPLHTGSLCHWHCIPVLYASFCVPPVLVLGPDLVPDLVAGEVRFALPKILIHPCKSGMSLV